MAVSVVDAIGPALNRTGRILFKPFDIGKWFTLGFCAWLAYLGQGGGGAGGGHGGSGGRGGGGAPSFDSVFEWANEHMAMIIAIGILVVLIGVAIGLLILWLNSRGQFMFLDGVARNRGAVVDPWRRFRELANSLFWFRFVLGLIGLAGLIVIGGLGVAIAWPDIAARDFGGMAVAGIATGVLLFIVFAIVMGVISVLLRDFVVPVMYLRGVRSLPAWRIFRYEVARGYFWNFVLFYLMAILLGLAIAIMAVVATCLTCCIAALPYIGTVILLPIYVFMRCYSLCFLRQFGPDWDVFPADPVPAAPWPPPPTVPGRPAMPPQQ